MREDFSFDDIDLSLIRELEANPLISNSELGEKVYSNRNTIARKISHLQEDQILNFSVIRHVNENESDALTFFMLKCKEEKIEEICRFLIQFKNIIQVNIVDGFWNIMFFGWFQDNAAILDFIIYKIGAFPEISSCQTLVALTTVKANYPILRRNKQAANKGGPTLTIDEIDLKLIEELEKSPRQNYSDLAAKLNISRHTVSKKIKYLIDNKLISIITYIDPIIQGYKIKSAIFVNVRPSQLDTIAEKLSEKQTIQNVIVCFGHYQLIVLGVFRDEAEYQSFLDVSLKKMEGVNGFKGIRILQSLKNLFQPSDSFEK